MWPFNRNKKEQSNYPPEVQDYYQSEKRERTGIAWLLALGTLIATVIIAISLFFGGRWLFNTIFNSDDDTSTSQTDQTQNGDPQTQSETDEAPVVEDQPEATEDNNQDDESEVTESEAPQPTTTPNTGPAATELPNTGPGL